jgi:hypothetical protein
MQPLPQDHAARIAELALSSSAVPFSRLAVAVLVDISLGDLTIDPDQAQQFAELALRAAVTAEILAGREATR